MALNLNGRRFSVQCFILKKEVWVGGQLTSIRDVFTSSCVDADFPRLTHTHLL